MSERLDGRLLPLMLLGPCLFATAFVLASFVENAVPLHQVVRPLVLALVVASLVQFACVLPMGSAPGSVWAFVIVAALAGMPVLAGAVLFSLGLFRLVGSRPARQYQLAGLLTTAVALVLLVVYVAAGASRGAFAWDPLPLPSIDLGRAAAGPSIHVLLLDGYPRTDVLEELDHDNTAFLASLEERGFDVYAHTRSNYDRTPFSLLTMLSFRHLDDLPALWAAPPSESRVEQERRVARALLDIPLFDALEAAGYRTRAISGPVVHVPIGGSAHDTSSGTATNFELDLLQRTPLAAPLELFGFAAGQQRAQIIRTLDAFASPPAKPSFTVAHVMAPHAPFVFDASGGPAPAPPCYPASCSLFESDPGVLGWSEEEHWQRMVDQVRYLNDAVVGAVDRILAQEPDAVIVLVSDHGVRRDGVDDALHRNLIVARTPDHPRLLGGTPTLVNVLPTIVSAYLRDADVHPLTDAIYRSRDDPWLSIERIRP